MRMEADRQSITSVLLLCERCPECCIAEGAEIALYLQLSALEPEYGVCLEAALGVVDLGAVPLLLLGIVPELVDEDDLV